MSLLDHKKLLELQAAILAAGLENNREALFVGINRNFLAGLPLDTKPDAQVLRDLEHLNNAEALADETVPLQNWLSNAMTLCGPRREADIFAGTLQQLTCPSTVDMPKHDRLHLGQQIAAQNDLHFSNGELLQAALAALLRRVPEISGVQILQDSHVLGKDIVFEFRSPLGDPIACACVVRNDEITGSIDSPSGARTIINRCLQALDMSLINGRGESIRIQRVYVICPHDVTQAVLATVQGALAKVPGEVQFVCGMALYDLFKRYWPDYLVDEASAIDVYLDRLKSNLGTGSSLEALASMYDLPQTPDPQLHIYVQPSFAYPYNEYALVSRLESCVPEGAELTAEWTQSRVRASHLATQHAKDLVSHVVEWGVWPLPPCPTAADTVTALDAAQGALRSAWDEVARKRVDWPVTRAAPRLSDDVKLRLPAEVGDRLLQSGMLLKEVDSLVEEQFRTAARELADRKAVTSLRVGDERIVRWMALNECILLAPKQFFGQVSQQSIQLGKHLLPSAGYSMLIVGPAGYGKTTFCRWNALRDTERLATGASQVIPVYVPLSQVGREKLADFDTTFLRRMGLSALVDNTVRGSWQAPNSRIRLYLDGLDEIPDVRKRKEVVDLIREGLAHRPNIQAVMTARDYVTAPWLSWLPRICLQGLDDTEIRTLGNLWFRDPEAENRFFLELARTPTLKTTMATPLLATLTVLVFKKTRKLPESKIRLYTLFAELLCGGWDLAKGVPRPSKFGAEIKMQILTQLGGALHQKNEKKVPQEQIRYAARKILSSVSDPGLEALVAELLMDGLITRAGTAFQFSHLSFQEFFAAKSMVGDPRAQQLRDAVSSLACGEDWWREVLGFYAGLVGDPHALWDWLTRSFRSRSLDPSGPVGEEFIEIIRGTYPGFRPQ